LYSQVRGGRELLPWRGKSTTPGEYNLLKKVKKGYGTTRRQKERDKRDELHVCLWGIDHTVEARRGNLFGEDI